MKILCNIIILLLSLSAFAGSEDRLRELVKQDVASKINGGPGLNAAEKKEIDAITEKLGVIESAQITQEAMSGIQSGAIKLDKSAKPYSDQFLQSKIQPSQKIAAAAAPPKQMTLKELKALAPAADAKTDSTGTPSPNITININPNSGQAEVVAPGTTPATEKDKDKKPAADKAEVKKDKVSIPKKLEDQMAKNYKSIIETSNERQTREDEAFAKNSKYIPADDPYHPSPTGKSVSNPAFKVERDASSIIIYSVNYTDAVTIQNCVADGVSILFGDSIKTTISKYIAGDDKYFSVNTIPGDRGISARLTKPIAENDAWYSSVTVFRKDDGKAYLINLVGLPCTRDVLRFPKVVYLEERTNRTNRADETLKLSDSEVLTPRDKIILESKGYKETKELGLTVEDMVASAGADVVAMSIQAAAVTKQDDIEFKVLDFHQVSVIKSTSKFLELHSKVHSERLGKSVWRWNTTVSIKKDYMLRRRYVYLMMLNHKLKEYQYLQIDTAEKLLDLKKREYDL